MDDLVQEFVEETVESLGDVENDLIAMEREPDADHDVGQLFRIVHTIKGTCSFIGLERLGSLAHSAENVLGGVRDGDLRLSEGAVSAVLAAMDMIRELLDGIIETGEEPDRDISPLVADLDAIVSGEAGAAPAPEAAEHPDQDGGDDTSGFADDETGETAGLASMTLAEIGSNAASAETGAPDDDSGEAAPMTLAAIIGGGSDDESDSVEDEDADGEAAPMTLAAIIGGGSDDESDNGEDEDAGDEAAPMTLAAIIGGGSAGESDHVEDEDAGDEAAPMTLAAIIGGGSAGESDSGADEDAGGEAAEETAATREVPLTLADIVAETVSAGARPIEDKPAKRDGTPVTLASIAGARSAPAPAESEAAPAAPVAVPAAAPVAARPAPQPVEKPKVVAAPKKENSPAPAASGGPASEARGQRAQNSASLRVSVDLLEHMMTLVGELVLTRNQLSQIFRDNPGGEQQAPLQRLSQVTGELQDCVMKTRMQPIGNAWNKLPRIIRDLSRDLGKKIDLVMEGAETELDRQVLELIKDPLTHMVRNSADHGIEMPDRRQAAGKPRTGVVRLTAAHQEGHIVITLSDDGAGLDAEAIRSRIIDRGLADEDEAAAMSPHQLHQFIFAPGFSTAQAVTSVSGRGVGMDVVRTNIEQIGGSVSMESELGNGTTFTIKIPLTLAIVSVLIVGVGEERYAVPQIAIHEVVRFKGRNGDQLERVGGSPLYRHRGELLPVAQLGELFGQVTSEEILDCTDQYVVICEIGGQNFGIICDQVLDTEEIVVKPIASVLKDTRYFSGNTILGDGSIVMIVDPTTLAGELQTNAIGERDSAEENEPEQSGRTFQMIVYEAVDGARKALPMALVDRLEEFEREQFEVIDKRVVVQYEGTLMPILDLSPDQLDSEPSHPVIVYYDDGSYLGQKIASIVDICDAEIKSDLEGMSSGYLGTTVIDGRAIEVVDVSHYLAETFPNKYRSRSQPYTPDQKRDANVLLVDDSAFFRNLVGPLLKSNGYQMSVVDHPQKVVELLDKGRIFDAIISDIEMPDLDGYQLLRRLRRHPNGGATPVIALSSHSTPADRQRGLNAGFDAYVSKLDKNNLLDALDAAIRGEEVAA